MKRVAIVCASIHHGNTKKLASVFAEELDAELLTVEEARGRSLSDYDLVGLGSGIYFGRHHQSLRLLVNSWDTPPKTVFLFSTAGLPFLRLVQHASLRRQLRKRGCDVISEFCCRGWDTVGPLWLFGGINRRHPDTRDLERARQFARSLKTDALVSDPK